MIAAIACVAILYLFHRQSSRIKQLREDITRCNTELSRMRLILKRAEKELEEANRS